VTRLRRQAIKMYFRERCHGGAKNQDFWKTIKPFISDKNKGQGNDIILRDGNDIISKPEEVCDIFNNYYSSIADSIGFHESFTHEPDTDGYFNGVLAKYDVHPSILKIKEHQSNVSPRLGFKQVTSKDVTKLLNKMDTKKSMGYDNIPHKLLKLSSDIISPFLSNCINYSMQTSTFPDRLKYAEVSSFTRKRTNSINQTTDQLAYLHPYLRCLKRSMLNN